MTMTSEPESQDEMNARNKRVADRYAELMHIGKHGHYETMFQIVREEVERSKWPTASIT